MTTEPSVEDPTVEALDVHDREYWPPADEGGSAAVGIWLAAHGVDANDVFRLELHPAPAGRRVLRVFRSARNEFGEYYLTADSEIASRLPLDVALRSQPPVPFRPAAT